MKCHEANVFGLSEGDVGPFGRLLPGAFCLFIPMKGDALTSMEAEKGGLLKGVMMLLVGTRCSMKGNQSRLFVSTR